MRPSATAEEVKNLAMECSIDPALVPFCNAPTSAQADQILERLIEEHAGPLIRKVLNAKFARFPSSTDTKWDYEDVYSSARSGLIRRLLRLRSEPGAGGLANFAAYVAKTAYDAWNDYTYARHPRLTKVRHRLQYLLQNRTSQKGFAIWEGSDGQLWCGFAAWERCEPDIAERNLRHALLAEDAVTATAAAFAQVDPKRLTLPEVTAGLLRWLGGPVELHTLASVIAELLDIGDLAPAALDAKDRQLRLSALVDPRPLPSDAAKWREYLAWLAAEVAQLPLRQRTAFLLHSSATRDFELCGVLSIRQLAALLEQPTGQIAAFWNDLPLDDLTIAGLLGLERQQVINLRSVARATLGRRWKDWSRPP
ncbi:MAG: hypothetical protein JOY92_04905 [Verrucomicrobia bacterium]|nr:hypothetical protein [Verrucomicrobiota bacterium]